MPEGLEAELYRRAADACVGRTIASVDVDERQELADDLRRELPGLRLAATRRIGKLVLLDTRAGRRVGPTIGLHFGMTGRLVVDGIAAIDRLEYASGRDDPAWDRLTVRFEGGGVLRVNDPRRWAVFTLDPDVGRLGPDVLTSAPEVLTERLREVFGRRRSALKAVLLDQSVVAGFGNMCIDEVLWHAGVSPRSPVDEVGPTAIDAIVTATVEQLPAMLARGGSHRGTIDPEVRSTLPPCSLDGEALRRDVVGGRATIWCPRHQR